MKISFWSKSLLLVICFPFFAICAPADDILSNDNFADGKAHWKGDGKDASSSDMTDISSPLSDQNAVGGMAVQLKLGWTVVYQVFNTHETALNFSMTYKTSSDFSTEGGSEGGGFMGDLQAFVENLLNCRLQPYSLRTQRDSAIVVIADPTQNEVIYSTVKLPAGTNNAQTVTTKLTGLMAHEEKTLCVIFPPGRGTVTLSNISLTAPSASDNTSVSPSSN